MMTLLTGGARSGKSAAAVELASRSDAEVVFVATAEPRDDEMARRIERHRADRPPQWTTIEAPTDLAEPLGRIDGRATVVIDCLGLWVTNLLDLEDEAILTGADEVASMVASRAGVALVVTNEVGSGIVPDNAVARRFRDVLGAVNRSFAARADHTLFCAAGGVLPLRPVEHIASGVLRA